MTPRARRRPLLRRVRRPVPGPPRAQLRGTGGPGVEPGRGPGELARLSLRYRRTASPWEVDLRPPSARRRLERSAERRLDDCRALPQHARRGDRGDWSRARPPCRASAGRRERRLLPECAARRNVRRGAGPGSTCACTSRCRRATAASRSGRPWDRRMRSCSGVAEHCAQHVAADLQVRTGVCHVSGCSGSCHRGRRDTAVVDFWGVSAGCGSIICDEPVAARRLRAEPRRVRHPPHSRRGHDDHAANSTSSCCEAEHRTADLRTSWPLTCAARSTQPAIMNPLEFRDPVRGARADRDARSAR